MAAQQSSFWNGQMARVMFLVLAIMMAIFAWLQYQKIELIKTSRSDITSSSELSGLDSNGAVSECAELRYTQIEQSVSDGFLDPSLVELEKEQAYSLCIAQVRAGN